jgi:hypothetical protein
MGDLQDKLDEFYDNLQVGHFSSKVFQGTDYESGYVAFFIDDEELVEIFEDQNSIYKKVAPNFYIIEIDKFEQIDRDYYNSIIKKYPAYFNKDDNRGRQRKKEKIYTHWDDIRKQLFEINSIISDINKEAFFFKPTVETMNWAFKASNLFVTNRENFGEFCKCLHQLGRESITKEGKEHIRRKLIESGKIPNNYTLKQAFYYFQKHFLEANDFYTVITDLRDMFSHIIEHMRRKDDVCTTWNNYCVEKIKKCPSTEDDYFLLQVALLDDFKNYLYTIRTFI